MCSVLLLSLGSGLLALATWPATAVAIDEADRLWMVGDQAFEDKLYSVSRRALERFIDRYPTDKRIPEATLLLGKARFSQKAFPGALEAFKQAGDLRPCLESLERHGSGRRSRSSGWRSTPRLATHTTWC